MMSYLACMGTIVYHCFEARRVFVRLSSWHRFDDISGESIVGVVFKKKMWHLLWSYKMGLPNYYKWILSL